MNYLTVDETTGLRLASEQHRAEIRDPTGRLLGYFLPVTEEYDGPECPLTDDELNQIEREGGGRPLSDILADLGVR
jgi:hypothetical protein